MNVKNCLTFSKIRNIMNGKTHNTLSTAVGINDLLSGRIDKFVGILIGGLVPDIDNKNSNIGKLFFFVSYPLHWFNIIFYRFAYPESWKKLESMRKRHETILKNGDISEEKRLESKIFLKNKNSFIHRFALHVPEFIFLFSWFLLPFLLNMGVDGINSLGFPPIEYNFNNEEFKYSILLGAGIHYLADALTPSGSPIPIILRLILRYIFKSKIEKLRLLPKTFLKGWGSKFIESITYYGAIVFILITIGSPIYNIIIGLIK